MRKTWQEFVEEQNLNWNVSLEPTYWYDPLRGCVNEVANRRALVRKDTGNALEIVSSSYKPVQNRELFSVLNPIAERGELIFEQANEVKRGRGLWALAEVPSGRFEARPNDEVRQYILLQAWHDGKHSSRFTPTSKRLFCENQLNAFYREAKARVRHSGNVILQLEDAEIILNAQRKTWAQFREAATLLARRPCVESAFDAVFNAAFPQPRPPHREADDEAKLRYERRYDKWWGHRVTVQQLYESGKGNGHHTLWDALNGVTEYVDHVLANHGRIQDRQLYITQGSAALVKERAFKEALALAA